MTARILMDTHADGLEEDPLLRVRASFEVVNLARQPGYLPTPTVTFHGPDGEAELVGRQQIEAAIAALQKALL